MGLTRKYLGALGIEQDKIDEIISAHVDTVNGLKGKIEGLEDQIKTLQSEAKEHEDTKKELADLKKQVEADAKEREGKDYDKLLKEFEDYKTEQANKEARSKKEAAYKEILKDAKIPERHFAKIIKYSDIDGLELDEKGKATNAKALLKEIKEECGDHVEKEVDQGANQNTPPDGNGGSGMTREEIMKIKDRNERQKAISENHELFGY